MTPRQLFFAFEGYSERVGEQWEMARVIAYYSSAPHVKRIRKLKDIVIPRDFMDKAEMSKEERQRNYDIMQAKVKKHERISKRQSSEKATLSGSKGEP